MTSRWFNAGTRRLWSSILGCWTAWYRGQPCTFIATKEDSEWEVLLLTRPGCGHWSLEIEIVPAPLLLLKLNVFLILNHLIQAEEMTMKEFLNCFSLFGKFFTSKDLPDCWDGKFSLSPPVFVVHLASESLTPRTQVYSTLTQTLYVISITVLRLWAYKSTLFYNFCCYTKL